jgi:hypothetical protein
MHELRNLTQESQSLYEDLIAKQEVSINELKKELLNSSSKDSYENILLINEQSEERLQSRITHQTGLMCFPLVFSRWW